MTQIAFLIFLFLKTKPQPMTLEITGISTNGGQVQVAIFNSEATFLDEKKYFKLASQPVQNGQKTMAFSFDLPPGEYAISAFHDENRNGKLDKNWVGIPTEPYGFSNNFIAKWGKPTWAKTKFSVQNLGGKLTINLEKW